MKKNMFLSICSLIMTTFLLFFLVYGWYVSNTEVSATGILGSTKGEDYEARLDRALIDAEGNVLSWEECQRISYSNLEPGNVMLFRLYLKSKLDTDINLKATFEEISTTITPNKLEVKGNKLYEVKTQNPIYDILNGSIRVIDKTSGSDVEKTLYNISPEGNIELLDYKLEDVFKVYDLGASEPLSATIPSGNLGFMLKDENGLAITAGALEGYHYFALELNEELSNKNVNGYISSNMYLYQTIKIGRISIIK